MTDTNSLRTGAGYALEVDLYAAYRAMIESAETIDTLRAQLAEAQRDAARYRWLRERWGRLAESYTDDGGRMAHLRVMSDRDVDAGLGWDVEASSLDAAIDAAKGEPS